MCLELCATDLDTVDWVLCAMFLFSGNIPPFLQTEFPNSGLRTSVISQYFDRWFSTRVLLVHRLPGNVPSHCTPAGRLPPLTALCSGQLPL